MHFRWAAFGALVVYLTVLLTVGFWAQKRTRGFRDFVTGGGRIPAWMLALSFLANFVSSNSFVGHSSRSYEVGLVWCLVGAMMVACCALSWFWFAPRFAAFAREHDAVTLPDFFEKRFASAGVAQLVHWIVVVATMFYLLAVLRGTGLVFAAGLGVSYPVALFVLYVVTVVYCIAGGMWADVSTDVVQAFVLVGGAIALFVALALAVPDPAALAATPPLKHVPLGAVIAVGIGGGVKLLADPKQVMVFYAFKDEAAARRFRWIGPILLAVVYACLFPIGYMARGVFVPPAEIENLVPSIVLDRQLLGPVFAVVFFVALLAASMSSLDSAYLMTASLLEKHVVSKIARGEPSANRTRVLLLVVATITLALSIRPLGTIIKLTTFSGALLGAALLPAIVAGFSKRRLGAAAATASIVAGCVGLTAGTLGKRMGIESPWFQDVFVGLGASTLVMWIAWMRAPAR